MPNQGNDALRAAMIERSDFLRGAMSEEERCLKRSDAGRCVKTRVKPGESSDV